MTIQEEKKRLRAILEGKITPGDADWEKIRTEKEFARIRQVMRQVGKADPDKRTAHLKDIWRALEVHRKEKNTPRREILLRWAAIAILFLLVGGGLWFFKPDNNMLTTQHTGIPVTNQEKVRLIVPGGKQVILSGLSNDTLLQQGEVKMKLDTTGKLTYGKTTTPAAPVEIHQLIVPRKCEYQLVLEDGTKVYLNAGSTLRYPSFFAGGQRQVFLEGEAYFEVARDAARPFLVETQQQNIRVLGTVFNVYTYPSEPYCYTSLVSGSVEVKDKQTGTEHILIPGQQVALNTATGRSEIKKADIQQVTAWKNGKFVFDGLTLEQIMNKLAYWYDLTVFYRNEEVKNYVFKGNIPRYETLGKVLDILEKTSNAKFKINNQVVVVGKE